MNTRYIYIVEDHSIFAENIEKSILNYLNRQEGHPLASWFSGVKIISENFAHWSQSFSNDQQLQHLFILDVSLDDQISGFQIAKAIREKDASSQFIFLTSHVEMMNEVFINNLKALSFINKRDVSMEDRLFSALDQFFHEIQLNLKTLTQSPHKKQTSKEDEYLTYQYKNTHYKINHKDILFVETDTFKRRLMIKTNHGIFPCQKSVEQLHRILPSFFMRVHRSIIVNRNVIISLKFNNGQYNILLKNNCELPVSKGYLLDLKAFLQKQ